MVEYRFLVCGLYFVVSVLLIIGSGRLCNHPVDVFRGLIGALLGAVYSGLCLLPQLRSLGSPVVRVVCLLGVGVVVFGLRKQAARAVIVFAVLNLSVEGCALAIGKNGDRGLLPAALMIFGLCLLSGRGQAHNEMLRLAYKDRSCVLKALWDTGNTLLDPVTGEQVLVVGPRAARELLGLKQEQLRDPIATMESCPVKGLRLIPYRSVGVNNGLLLGIRLERIEGGRRRPVVVGFAAEGLEAKGVEALIGGAV